MQVSNKKKQTSGPHWTKANQYLKETFGLTNQEIQSSGQKTKLKKSNDSLTKKTMSKKIKKIKLKDENIGNTHVSVNVYISDNEDLVIDAYDFGEAPKKVFGDSSYEFISTIKKGYKDTILLLLIKEKFEDNLDIRKWLEKKNIPIEHFTW
jgi:hypothetical protein